MSPETKQKFRIKAPETEPISPKDKDTGKEKFSIKPKFKAKDATYKDKLAAMQPDKGLYGKETGTKSLHFNVKGSRISSEIDEKTPQKKGFLSKISRLKRKSVSVGKKDETEKKKFRLTPKKDNSDRIDSGGSSKKFKMKESRESTLEDTVPPLSQEKIAFKQKKQKEIEKTEAVKENIAFKQKTQIEIEETQTVKEKTAFKQKKQIETEETPVEKEKIAFKQKEATPVEKAPSQEEKTLFQAKKIEQTKKDTESKVQIASGDVTDSPKKTLLQKEKEHISGFRRKKSRPATKPKKQKFGGLFSSNILNGIVLCVFTIVATYILSSIKNSPDNSMIWEMCFVPQLFLLYVVILILMYVTSIALVFMGIQKKFKER